MMYYFATVAQVNDLTNMSRYRAFTQRLGPPTSSLEQLYWSGLLSREISLMSVLKICQAGAREPQGGQAAV